MWGNPQFSLTSLTYAVVNVARQFTTHFFDVLFLDFVLRGWD